MWLDKMHTLYKYICPGPGCSSDRRELDEQTYLIKKELSS